jgi:6-phosphofructokinase 1
MAENKGNAVVAQSGGPTAVINQSVVGVVQAAKELGLCEAVLGARHGVRGMVEGDFVELQGFEDDRLEAIAGTPSAALGSTRDKPDEAYCERILESLVKQGVRYFFYIGGNDSSDTCRIVNEVAKDRGHEMRCFHVPKTIDNDLVENDHTPGYASAARYVAKAFLGDALDNRALPGIKINVVMGRHAGFLTGAAALCREEEADGPQLVYVPERAFDLDAFARRVDEMYTRHGRCQIAVSEGIQDANGESIGAKLIEGEKDAHGNVQLSGSGALGDQLASYLKTALTPAGGKPPRVRADTLGYPQRCYPDASPVDQCEARGVGRFAVECANSGDIDGSIAIVRKGGGEYGVEFKRVELSDVAAKTRHMPDEWINEKGDGVTEAFLEWLRPLVGEMPVVGRV